MRTDVSLRGEPPSGGKINAEVILQDLFWWDSRGALHELSSISPEYAHNIYHFLLRKALWLHSILGPNGDGSWGNPEEASTWLRRTPLMLALRESQFARDRKVYLDSRKAASWPDQEPDDDALSWREYEARRAQRSREDREDAEERKDRGW